MAIERRPAITAATWRATDPDAMDAAAQKFVGVAGLIASPAIKAVTPSTGITRLGRM